MCFSATASFGSGVVLTAVGVATLAKTKHRSEWVFAAIPLLFGIQQIAEGFTWLTLMHSEDMKWQTLAVNSFLFFSHILWPVWIPLSVYLMEKEPVRKKIYAAILGLGIVLAVSELYCMIVFPTIAIVNQSHIDYTVAFPRWYAIITEGVYFVVTLLPCYISSVKRMWLFGYCLTLTLVMSAIFYKMYVVSIWCFFAALTSVVIYFILWDVRKSIKLKDYAP